MAKEDHSNPVCIIKTSMGDVYVELFAKEAPDTVKNFIELAEGKKEYTDPVQNAKVKNNFYDNLIFHRILPGFVIQALRLFRRHPPVIVASNEENWAR